MTTNRIRIPVLVATGLAAAIALAGCNSSGGSYGSGPGSTQQQAAGTGMSQTANLTEFHIALSSSKLKSGTYTFHVKNTGSITHAFTVNGPGVKDKSTGDMPPGVASTLTVTLRAGRLTCPSWP